MHDVAVVGLGAMGSAAARELARRGLAVIGFDRATPPHTLGSSHGASRIIREAYFEDPVYVPMVQRAYTLWRQLEAECGRPLLRETGGLMIGPPDSVLVTGARRSAELHRLPHDVLDARTLQERFPAFTPEPNMVGVWEPRAGVLDPEACVAAQLEGAARAGASLHYDTTVLGWSSARDGVALRTTRGNHRARRLVLAAGPWIGTLLSDVPSRFQVERQVLTWFSPTRNAEDFAPGRCPIHLWQFDGHRFFYGFPDLGEGVKLAFHHGGRITTAEHVQRTVEPGEVDGTRSVIRRYLPAADGPLRRSAVCLYTNTPDEHFRLARHPQFPDVVIASPCSGHGFKFAPVIGEIVADLVEGREPGFDLAPFAWR
jgi:sarcosine oxidase